MDEQSLLKKLEKLRLSVGRLDAAELALLPLLKNGKTAGGISKALAEIQLTRNDIVRVIGLIKIDLGLPVRCAKRETQMLAELKTIAKALNLEITDKEIDRHFKLKFKQARKIQTDQRRD